MMRVEFLSSYQNYIESLKFMISLAPEIVCPAHGWVLTSEDAMDFLKSSLAETFRYRELIESYLDTTHGNVEKAIQDMAHVEYDVKGDIFQERVAYMTNLKAQVKLIAGLRDANL
jgi:glyoxylase-like metal-dependent hydrolase (beta-lactamase superfamily II)